MINCAKKFGPDLDQYFYDETDRLTVDYNSSCSEFVLSWKNLSCSAVEKDKSTPILENVSGIAFPGEILGVMGMSGSGKSFLLRSLASCSFPNSIRRSGTIKVNGNRLKNIKYEKISSFVPQEDVLLSSLTPFEAFIFSLHMKTTLPYGQKLKKVRETLRDLNLLQVANNRIGSLYDSEISGGERRRVSIGVELISDSSILILDEPLSGLDSFTASETMTILKKLSLKGKTIILSIHQASLSSYMNIDKLLLLSAGKTVFQGKREEALNAFEELGFECPENVVPSDFFIKVLFIKNTKEKTEEEERRLKLFLGRMKNDEDLRIERRAIEVEDDRPGFFTRFKYLLDRTAKDTRRNKTLANFKLIQSLTFMFVTDMVFYNFPENSKSDQNFLGALFFICMMNTMPFYKSSLFIFQNDRKTFFKEKKDGLYGVEEYYISKVLTELPMLVICSSIFSLGTYWMLGLNDSKADKWLIYCNFYSDLCLFLAQYACVGFAHFTSALSTSLLNMMLITIVIGNGGILFVGFFVNLSSQMRYISWARYTTPFYYALGILAINEFSDCDDEACSSSKMLELLDLDSSYLPTYMCNMLILGVSARILAYIVLKIKKE